MCYWNILYKTTVMELWSNLELGLRQCRHQTQLIHLLIELVDNALRPLQMQVLVLQRPVDVSQFDAHLAHQ